MTHFRVWYWDTISEKATSGWVSDLVHRQYDEAVRELEQFQDTEPEREFYIARTDKDGNDLPEEDTADAPEIYMKRRTLEERMADVQEALELAEDLQWRRVREMAAYRAFRKLVPYLEKKSAKSLFLAGRTTTAEAFRRGAEFGRRHGR